MLTETLRGPGHSAVPSAYSAGTCDGSAHQLLLCNTDAEVPEPLLVFPVLLPSPRPDLVGLGLTETLVPKCRLKYIKKGY